eukprot:CAMPEP_0117009232 /NCGR_PEP_ID=MMETSP0472-20121206/8446_1 /TAXON_ID=693140 ORGANISM="Tiarina fusus, Strain LIS" /NCGR_SAMPLE_ID=MMETSP0472 /ASSEMBLY_ACC=CAM_ASM_000603 /LENGTH=694 /DNA_ID=CAMNT_0004711463 /DNA_START=21 /DNA_END=2105 /DNA_ORIENTATION=+
MARLKPTRATTSGTPQPHPGPPFPENGIFQEGDLLPVQQVWPTRFGRGDGSPRNLPAEWVRDLTTEGVEPNPGPPMKRGPDSLAAEGDSKRSRTMLEFASEYRRHFPSVTEEELKRAWQGEEGRREAEAEERRQQREAEEQRESRRADATTRIMSSGLSDKHRRRLLSGLNDRSFVASVLVCSPDKLSILAEADVPGAPRAASEKQPYTFERGNIAASSLDQSQAEQFSFDSGPSVHFSILDLYTQTKAAEAMDSAVPPAFSNFVKFLAIAAKQCQNQEPGSLIADSELARIEAPFKSHCTLEFDRLLRSTYPTAYATSEFPVRKGTKGACQMDSAVIVCPDDEPFARAGEFMLVGECKLDLSTKAKQQHKGYFGDLKQIWLAKHAGRFRPLFGLRFDISKIVFAGAVPMKLGGADDGQVHLAVCDITYISFETTPTDVAGRMLALFLKTAMACTEGAFDLNAPLLAPLPVQVRFDDFRTLGRNSILILSKSFVVKTFDYNRSSVSRSERRQPNEQYYSDAWAMESGAEVKKIDESISILRYPFKEGGHTPVCFKQFGMLCTQVGRLHAKRIVHGDIRSLNVVFSTDGNHCWLIDFDIAGSEGSLYPANLARINARHRDAEGGKARSKVHDTYSLRYLLTIWFEQGETTHAVSKAMESTSDLCALGDRIVSEGAHVPPTGLLEDAQQTGSPLKR